MGILTCNADGVYEERGLLYELDGDTAKIIGHKQSWVSGVGVFGPGYAVAPDSVFVDSRSDEHCKRYIVTSVEISKNSDYYKGSYPRYVYARGLGGLPETIYIILPSTVRRIGEKAIRENHHLDRIEMPGVEYIGDEAVAENGLLADPIELRRLEILGKRGFQGCWKLTEIRFGQRLRRIGANAFEGCVGLRTVDICSPDVWSKVEFETELSNPIALSGHFNVFGNEVRHLDIDVRKGKVSPYAFRKSRNLRSVRVRNAARVGRSAFDSCVNVKDICLDVDSIDDRAFADIKDVRRIYVMREEPPQLSPTAFSDYDDVRVYVPRGSLARYKESEYSWRLFRYIRESDFSEVEERFRADYDEVP